MMPGIIETLQQVAEARGVNWEGKLEEPRRRASGTSRSTTREAIQGFPG